MGRYADSKLKDGDLRTEAIELFKEKAVRRRKLMLEETRVEDFILLDNLHLINEDGYLVRATMLAFYKDLEMGYGARVKIGYFAQ